MKPHSERFAQLRKLLTRPPTSQRWWSLCSLLEQWPASKERSLALEYAQKHLESWPDELRLPLCTWPSEHPGWSLATSQQPRFSRYSKAVAVWCPPGQFLMGAAPDDPESSSSESPQTIVTLSHGFWMQATPVTQHEWHALMGNNPSRFQGDTHPVENVSWYDAIAYCNALSRLEGLEECTSLQQVQGTPGTGDAYDGGFMGEAIWNGFQCNGISLPTEAEWEYACRAGSRESRYAPLADIAINNQIPGITLPASTQPVGQKQPNEWGLYDLLGNVWEWCLDSWQSTLQGGEQVDPIHFTTFEQPELAEHGLRGGAWSFSPRYLRASARHWHKAHRRYNGVGFRPVRRVV